MYFPVHRGNLPGEDVKFQGSYGGQRRQKSSKTLNFPHFTPVFGLFTKKSYSRHPKCAPLIQAKLQTFICTSLYPGGTDLARTSNFRGPTGGQRLQKGGPKMVFHNFRMISEGYTQQYIHESIPLSEPDRLVSILFSLVAAQGR